MPRVKQTLPLIPIRALTVFPYMILHFDVARPRSIRALEYAMASNRLIFLTAQIDASVEDPTEADLQRMGTVARVKQLLKLPGDGIRVLVEGVSRGEWKRLNSVDPYMEAEVVERKSRTNTLTDEECDAIMRQLRECLEQYLQLNPDIVPEALLQVLEDSTPGQIADTLAGNLLVRQEDKQTILSLVDVRVRLNTLLEIMAREIKVLEIEGHILERVNDQMEENNRDYFLREQMKAIRAELGDKEENAAEAEEYRKKFAELDLPDYVAEKAEKEINRFLKMPPQMVESGVIRAYLDLLLEIPWSVTTPLNQDLNAAEAVLERDHFGLEKLKERVLEYLAVRTLSNEMRGTVLCLVGPPGVGKTSIARSVAEATGRNYARISLGGIRDEAEIRGHRRTYVGAMAGRMIAALTQAKSKNPLILLDEIDKLCTDLHGDPASAMLEVLDMEQNHAFRDHYVEIPVDLSEVMFLATANTLDSIPRPLLDRMEVIELNTYTREEKLQIAQRYLLPKQMKKHGLKRSNLRISDNVIEAIISNYTREAGVRNLERYLATICRKAATELVRGERKRVVSVSPTSLHQFLGAPIFLDEDRPTQGEIGVVTGLAWTQVGGDTLTIEVNVMDGTGKLELTGNLGDVMKESAHAALSYVRSRAGALQIDPQFYKTKDIHVHVPEGATPKDGPSAGITIATALASALSQRSVRGGIAMTGEITLRGRVLPIGGLKEKSLAAYRLGIQTIFIPKKNEKDLQELPETVRKSITFRLVENCDEVLEYALLPALPKQEPAPRAPHPPLERRTLRNEYS